jgi:hypothetical protein
MHLEMEMEESEQTLTSGLDYYLPFPELTETETWQNLRKEKLQRAQDCAMI